MRPNKAPQLIPQAAEVTMRKSSAIRIVEFEPRHQEAFTALNLAWIEEYFEVEEIDRRQLLNPADSILGPGGAILVAEDSTGVLGVCALLRASPGRYEISKLTVRSDLRGHGIGQRLLAAVIAHARTLDAKELFIETNTALQPAVHLYRKAGFTEVPPPVSTEYGRCNIAFELSLTQLHDPPPNKRS